MYASVGTRSPIFTYLMYAIPDHLTGQIAPGHLVLINLKTATDYAIVISLSDEPIGEDGRRIDDVKPILQRLHPEPVVTEDQIALAERMRERYAAPIGACLWLMLPPGLEGKRGYIASLIQENAEAKSPTEARILELIAKKGTLRSDKLKSSIRVQDRDQAVNALAQRGIISLGSVLLPSSVHQRKIQVASITIHPERLHDTLSHLGKHTRESTAFRTIARLLIDEDGFVPVETVLEIPGIGQGTLDHFIAAGLGDFYDDDLLSLSVDVDQVEQRLFEQRGGELDLHILRVLAREEKPVDVSWVYAQTGAKLDDLKRLETLGFIELGEQQQKGDLLWQRDYVAMTPPRLTGTQREIWQTIRRGMDERRKSHAYLLHGVTGSGKTEIYLRAMEYAIAQGRSAMFLVPEIALTAQTIRRVMARFPGQVVILGEDDEGQAPQVALVHGKIRQSMRYDVWQQARAGEINIIVGTRSALFTPLADLGLIILDEEHDHSYKQSAPTSPPYYHTREIAEWIVRESNGTLLLGSATPDVESVYRAQQGQYEYLHLPDRIMGHRIKIAEDAARIRVKSRYIRIDEEDSDAVTIPLPPVSMVDMREELKAGNISMFSRELQAALTDVLRQEQQAILFINRRGRSTYVFCRDCGYVAACPRCDMPLTYHTHLEELQCHYCGHHQAGPETCPNCGSSRIKFFGAGTQQVEEAASALFPQATFLRWDADTAGKPGGHDLILTRFTNRQADVLIGTQMVAKGLDLPLVTLVGVISADVGLNLPDFRAAERTFQVLAQVAGRAGRGLLGGRVILQTYQPDHYAVKAAAKHDYDGFYETEIEKRRQIGYPPFRRLLRVVFQDEREPKARRQAEQAAALLRTRLTQQEMTGTELIGPAPCFFSRINKNYRWQILLRGPNPTTVFDNFPIPPQWRIDVDPLDVL